MVSIFQISQKTEQRRRQDDWRDWCHYILNPTDHAGLQRLVRNLDCADSGVDRVRIRNL